MDKQYSISAEVMEGKGRLDRIIESVLVFLFFITPLTRAGINIITPILTIFWVVKKIKYRKHPDEKFCYSEINRWVGILGVAILLSFINAVNLQAAVKNFADEYILFALIFIISLDVIRSKELIKRLFFAATVSSLIVAVWGLYEHFGIGRTRISSTITGANELGTYSVSMAIFSISLLLFGKKLSQKRLIGIFLFSLLSLSCVVFSGSRGAWLSFFAGLVVLLFFGIQRKQLNLKRLSVLFLVFILVAASIDLGWVIKRLDSIDDLSNSSNRQRIMMAMTGLEMLKDHPLFGVGIGQFKHVYEDYKLAGANLYTHIHCLYIHLAVEIGLIGFFVFLALVLKILKAGLKASLSANHDQWFYLGTLGVLVGFGVHNVFEWSFLNLQVGAFTLILIAIWLKKINLMAEE